MDTAEYLRDLARDLARAAVASSELVILEFDANGRDVQVKTRRKAHPASYPPLGEMLSVIGSHCVNEGITVAQLKGITFTDHVVRVKFMNQGQRMETRDYSVTMVIRPATPRATYVAMLEDRMASRSTAGRAGQEADHAAGKPSRI